VTRLAWLAFVLLVVAGCQNERIAARPTSSSPLSAASPQPFPSPAVGSQSAEPNPLWIGSIQRLDARTGFIATVNHSGPLLARTNDAGAHWQDIAPPVELVTTIRFIDTRVGWVAGLVTDKDSAVFRTIDGGATWQQTLRVPAAQGNFPPLGLQAIDSQVAWALIPTCDGCTAELRRTVDGGRTWTSLTAGNIAAMRFATTTRGWIAVTDSYRNSYLKVTSDGGRTWSIGTHVTSGSVVGLDTASSLTAWALVRDGGYCSASTCTRYELLRTTDGGVSWNSLGNPKPTSGTCAGGHLYGPLFASPVRGWLAENTGAGGAMTSTGFLQSDDGGLTWRCHSDPTQTDVLSAADPTHVWVTSGHAGGEVMSLHSSDDGGLTWRALSLRFS